MGQPCGLHVLIAMASLASPPRFVVACACSPRATPPFGSWACQQQAATRSCVEGSGFGALFAQADARSLPLKAAAIDRAFSVTVLGEIPDRGRALREIKRVLRTRGWLPYVSTWLRAAMSDLLMRLLGSMRINDER